MKKSILLLLCIILAALTTQVEAQFTVNFQYTNSAGGGVPLYTGSGVSGFGTGTFWNTVPGPSSSQTLSIWNAHSTSQSSLADDGVTETGIKWSLGTKGNFVRSPVNGIPLLNAYAICHPSSGSLPFAFTNVPDGTYNVVLFGLGGANTGAGTSFTINGLTLATKEAGGKSGSFIMYTNYVVFSNVVASGGAINGTWQSSASTNTIDAHFNGAQLQRISDKTVYAFPPSIAPSNSVAAGTMVTITANAVGAAPVSYQWQTDGGGSTFTDIPGAVSNPLQVDTTGLLGVINYQVIVTDASGSVTSAPVALTVNYMAAPDFLPNPPTATPGTEVFIGGQITLATTVSGSQPITNQWQVDHGSGATDIADATNVTITLTNLQLSDAGNYSLYAANSVGSSNSLPINLTVLANPAAPDADSFAGVVLTNNPIDYWRLNDPVGRSVIYDWAGTHIGANSNITLGVTGPQSPDYPGFSSTNTAGSFDGSSSAMRTGANLMNGLTNFTVMGWFNPSGANPVNISGLFGQNGVVEVGYFDESGVTVWMPTTASNSWTILHSGTAGFSTGQWYFTAIVADGANVKVYVNGQLRAQALNAGAPKGTSSYGFNVGGGFIFDTTSSDTFNGLIGDVAVFNKALTADQLQSIYAAGVGVIEPSIVTSPDSQEVLEGHTVSFTVGAYGFPLTYQWQAGPVGGPYTNLNNGGNISGATNLTLTLTDVSPAQTGEYLVVVTNSAGSVTSTPAMLTVDSKPDGQWVVNFDFDTTAGGVVGHYSGSGVLGNGGYWNQILGPNSSVAGTYTSASGYTDDAGSDTEISLSLTTSGNWSSPGSNDLLDDYALAIGGAKSFAFNNVFDGVYNVVLFGADGSLANRGTTFTLNGVKSTTNTTDASFVEGDNYVIFRNVTPNNGVISGTWAANPVLIGGTNNTEGDFCGAQLQYVGGSLAPSIITQPASTAVLETHAAQFTVGANGYPLNYQWQSGPVGGPYSNLSDGGNISGATRSTLIVSNVVDGSPVEYRVIVSNDADSVTSDPATLTVISQTQTWVVNYDFDTTEGGVAGTYSGPGVVGSGTYWNSIPGPNFWSQSTYTGTGGLTDDGAINTGISCSVAMDGNWCYPPSSPNNALLDDYAEALNSIARPFTFNNVYNGVYNLVLFGVNGGYKQDGTVFTVNGVSKSTVNTTDTQFVGGDNYVIFRNLIVTNGVISGTYGANPILVEGATNVQGDFCGAQLQYVGQSVVDITPTLNLQTVGGQLQLQWSPGSILLEATNIAGPWTTNSEATSPYVIDTSSGQKFFRVFVQ